MLVLREQDIILKHDDTSQALRQLALLDLFFFSSGKEAIIQESMQKSLSKGCPSKFPSITPPLPSCPSWDDNVSACLYARLQQGLRLASAAAL